MRIALPVLGGIHGSWNITRNTDPACQSVSVHKNLEAAWAALRPERVYAFTAHASVSYAALEYRPGDVFLFGPEPTGLSDEVLADPHVTATVRIPMLPGRRSLNLSNAAAVVTYEAWRQLGFAGAV